MGLTVKDLFEYDINFEPAKIRRLTGKTNYKKNDSIDLLRLAALNDKNLSIFAAKKDKGVVSYITDDSIRTQVANASNVKDVKNKNTKENEQKYNNITTIPMKKSIFDINKNVKKVV